MNSRRKFSKLKIGGYFPSVTAINKKLVISLSSLFAILIIAIVIFALSPTPKTKNRQRNKSLKL